MNIKLVIEYNGLNFNGWQKQKNKLNIQGRIEKAIFDITGKEVELIGAGRTDANVHAYNQIANFHTDSEFPIEKYSVALNAKLKNNIIIKSAELVSDNFHSRYNAKSRTYRYIINNSDTESSLKCDFEYFMYSKLDIKKMQEAIKYFEGEHDFSAFKSSGTSSKSSIRKIYKAEVKEVIDKDDNRKRIYIELTGSGFLYNMVRIISGTLLEVGLGKIEVNEVKDIIKSKDRKKAGKTLPAKALFLLKVDY